MGTAKRLKRDKVVKIARLSSCTNFVSKREKFIFDAFVDLQSVERFENGNNMSGFRSLNNSASKRVLNLLKPVKLTVWKVMIERVRVVKFRVNYGGGNGAGCFEVKPHHSSYSTPNVMAIFRRKPHN